MQVRPGKVDAAATKVTGQGVTGGTAGSKLSVLVTPRDEFGNTYTTGPLDVAISATLTQQSGTTGRIQSTELPLDVNSLANGSYSIAYSSKQVGC